jgi:hypothetical protein
MSLDEFVLAFTGVVIGLGVADLLTSFHKLLRAGSRVKWDWLTLLYATYMLFGLVIFWRWQFGYPPEGQTFTIIYFLPNFLFLALAFLMVASALPDDVPPEGIDLRDFYFRTVVHRWGLLAASLAGNLALLIWVSVFDKPDWLGLGIIGGCLLLALLAIRFRVVWFHGSILGVLLLVSAYANLFAPFGPA